MTEGEKTIEFREQTKASFAALENDGKTLHNCFDDLKTSFDSFKNAIWDNMDDRKKEIAVHDVRLARIETSLGTLVKVMWVIVTCSAGLILTAGFRLILK